MHSQSLDFKKKKFRYTIEILFQSNLNVYIYIYIYVKFFSRDLNPGLCSPHLTSTYICGVITIPKMHSGTISRFIFPSIYLTLLVGVAITITFIQLGSKQQRSNSRFVVETLTSKPNDTPRLVTFSLHDLTLTVLSLRNILLLREITVNPPMIWMKITFVYSQFENCHFINLR